MALSVIVAALSALFAGGSLPTEAPAITPVAATKVKVFVIAPEDSDHNFMCESGQLQSLLATAVADHRVVSVEFLDQTGAPLPVEQWGAAFGFRLAHQQSVKIQATMMCGD